MTESLTNQPEFARALQLQSQADQLQATLETSKQQVWDLEKQARKIETDLELTKFRALQSVLRSRTLGVCSAFSWRKHVGNAPENLGIFPLEELRLLYQTYFLSSSACNPYSSGSQVTEIELLCPRHFPRVANTLEGRSMRSEIVEEEGRYFTLVNDIDITAIPVTKYYPSEVYRFFKLAPSKGTFFYTTLTEPDTPIRSM